MNDESPSDTLLSPLFGVSVVVRNLTPNPLDASSPRFSFQVSQTSIVEGSDERKSRFSLLRQRDFLHVRIVLICQKYSMDTSYMSGSVVSYAC